MIDYSVKYKYQYIDDIELNGEKILAIEDDIHIEPNKKDKEQDIEFELAQIIEGILTEKLKEYFECEQIEIIDFEPVNKQENLYKFSYDDYYYYDEDEYQYKGDIEDKTKEFIGKDMKEFLDIINTYK
jgi:hypothetical protein